MGTDDVFTESEATLDCRSCHNPMPVDSGSCPHCGSRTITTTESIGLAVGGFVLAALTGYVGLWPFTALGVLVFVVGLLFFQRRRTKIKQARA